MKYYLYFDGACEPKNPGGRGTYGWVLKNGKVKIAQGNGVAREPGPTSTNNVAEYTALIKGLEGAKQYVLEGDTLEVYGDSQLVINQMCGAWRVKSANIKGLYNQAKQAGKGMNISYQWVNRSRNKEADDLSKSVTKEQN